MDDLTNRIAALVEEHVKREVEARTPVDVWRTTWFNLASEMTVELEKARADLAQARMDIACGLERERKLAENLEERSEAVLSLRAEADTTRLDLATACREVDKARADLELIHNALKKAMELKP